METLCLKPISPNNYLSLALSIQAESKSLKDVFEDQHTKINAMLDGEIKNKIKDLKGHPKMEEIRQKTGDYCKRLFEALRNLINEARNKMNDYRDWQQRRDLENLVRDIQNEEQKCKYRFYAD